MIGRIVAAFLATLAVTACVSADLYATRYYTVSAEDAARLTSGAMGATIVDLKTGADCANIDLRYVNLDTGAVWTRNIELTYTAYQISSINAGAVPTIILLPPGRYAFQGGECRWATGGYAAGGITTYKLSLDSMALWLRPFVVRGGEIAYTGTAEYEEFVQPWRALTSVEHPTEQDRRSVDRYGLYEVRDNEAAVREALQRHNPSLADRFVNRTAPALLDKATARRIIADAYAAAVSVDPPDNETANANAVAARTQAVHALRRYHGEQLEQLAAGAEGQTTASRNSSR